MQAEAVSGPLDLGDQVADALDAGHLLLQVLRLQEVAEVGVPLGVGGLVEVEQALVDGLLELQRGLEGVHDGAPVHGGGLGDVLEHDPAATLALVVHQLDAVAALLVRLLLEVGGEAVEGLVVTGEVGALGEGGWVLNAKTKGSNFACWQ